MTSYDVVVAGAGPVGLMVASELALRGVRVLVAERLSETLPELHLLLTGPARGYVRSGLERLGIPYRHLLLPDVDAVAEMYPAIDVCLVA